jgi:hypothetical protein
MLGVLRGGGSTPDVIDAFASKVGGASTFFQEEDKQHPVCASCNEALVLVCQIYAPIPGVYRSLIVLSCSKCGPDATWKVLRSQQPEATLPADANASYITPANIPLDPSSTPPIPPSADPEPAASAWDVAGDDWGVGDTDSDADDDKKVMADGLSNVEKEQSGLDEISEMLNKRDLLAETLLENPKQSESATSTARAPRDKNGVMCRRLDIVEPYAATAAVEKNTALS